MKIPDEPKKGLEIYDWIRSLVRYLRATRITSVMGGYLKESPSGTILVIDKQKGQTTEEAATTPCPFGELITFEGDRYIRGGVVYGGDNNWNVADYLINLAADSDNLIWLEVGVTANTEDSVLMPNLESSTEPTWESGTVAGGYPSNTAPNITTGVGTRIVPIGQLTVVDGVATLDPVGCGNITLGFCPPNNLSIARA